MRIPTCLAREDCCMFDDDGGNVASFMLQVSHGDNYRGLTRSDHGLNYTGTGVVELLHSYKWCAIGIAKTNRNLQMGSLTFVLYILFQNRFLFFGFLYQYQNKQVNHLLTHVPNCIHTPDH